MGELKQIYLLIHSDIAKENIKEAFITYNTHYKNIKDIEGFQNFTVSVISALAQKLQSELSSNNQTIQSRKNVDYVIKFGDRCFEMPKLSDLQHLQNSLYVIIRYLLSYNYVIEAVRFSNYFLKYSSSPCDILKHLVQLFAHFIHNICPIDDDLKKLNVILMWDAALNLVKQYTEKEIDYALYSLAMLVKNINGKILHEGRSMDLVILDMTLESVLSSVVFRKKSDQDNMMNLYSKLIENIVAVMQNMMRRKQIQIQFLVKHIELMIDVCSLTKTEKEDLSFLILLFKFIDNSVKNGLDSNFEIRKMITIVQKYEPCTILPNTMSYHVMKAAIITITKLKNLWYDELIINSSETVSQMFLLLQNLFYLSKNGSISMICCKSKNCDLYEDSTSEMNLINIVFIMIRHIISTNVTFLNSEDVLKWMNLFTSLFKRVCKSKCSNKIPFIEFSLTSAYNLCIQKNVGELSNLCMDFLENVCLMLDPSGINPDLVARVAILLSRYLYNNNKNDDALKCIAYWCVQTRSDLAAQQWVCLKCKEEKNNRFVKQTILKMFDDKLQKKWPVYSLKKSDCIEIMWLELKAHNYQYKVKQDMTSVLELFEDLMSSSIVPRELKCRVVVTVAYIILYSNNIDGLESVIDVLEDYICKLEVETSIEKNSMPLVMGCLYYASFICSFKHLQNRVSKELDSFTEERLERGTELQNIMQYEPMAWIHPLKIKPKIFNYLNCAVKNWSNLINDTISDEYYVKIIFESLHEAAFVFKLHCDPKEVEVWQLLYKLASNIKSHKYIFIALSELMKIGRKNDQCDNLELDNLAKKLPKMAINYKLTLVTIFLNQSKYKDAQILLDSIDKEELNNYTILTAEYSYLRSRLCFESRNFNNSKCLSIFIEAYNLAHGLIKRLDSFYEYLVMHFVILSICSYLNLIFVNTLKPVEARCFLKVQMKIVLKSVLTKRALNVFIMSCWNELMCCNLENVNGQLEHLMILLDFKEDEFDSKIQSLTISHSTNILSSPLSDYRCVPNNRVRKMASPSLKQFNNQSTQMSITEFCKSVISGNVTYDSIILYSVIEVCIIKAICCSMANQQNKAENDFKMIFKLLELVEPQFNKNEVYNTLTARQNSLAKYHYGKHLVFFNNSTKSLDCLKKAKELCKDKWLSLYVNELSLSLKIYEIMSYPDPNINHSPKVESHAYKYQTPATKIRVNTKPQALPRFVTPTVRKLRMTLESPKSRENKIKSPVIRETEKLKKDSTAKKKIGKENIIKSTMKADIEVKVREKRSTRKKETTEQTSTLVIKKHPNRLNI
ncbi:uncharacterized protein LOC112692557 isoform X1 [Sipha flava]|uniref:Uncharacterized protein LOC112692557 isoform X1 n=1 Tax=Sipha flava TaxID=143950 RepID=A0A8B8GJ45_9HEMI|nr:uncharacterized protein LOC112692557 isoform X1 [Sipha flava]XP_025423049.1 uncharacterized protein LOC112692557 isoform X1 [Sipha flava]XP_025423050.1 uncharacterized protein LOC112692557 isoform X1 [Sipha flava]